jgi:hypothetical protein
MMPLSALIPAPVKTTNFFISPLTPDGGIFIANLLKALPVGAGLGGATLTSPIFYLLAIYLL